MSDLLKLPSERLEQLRQLADVRHTTITDLVGDLVREQFAALNLPLTVPGIDVRRARGKVVVDFGDFTKSFSPELACAFATALRLFARPKQRPGIRAALHDTAEAFSGAHLVGIGRRGTSVVISEGEHRRVLAPGIARDLADVIETAAGG